MKIKAITLALAAATAVMTAAPAFATERRVAVDRPAAVETTATEFGARRGRNAAFAIGAAIGILGTAAAVAATRPDYYDPGYSYGPGYGHGGHGYYEGGYVVQRRVYVAPQPVYVEPPRPVYVAPRTTRCWVSTDRDRGFGYWTRCRY
jgi:hypothetical protein